jgi:hypothetical protein
VARQREILGQHVAAALPTDGPLQLLAECETALADLRHSRNYIRAQIAADTTQQLMQSFWALPAERRRSLVAS